MRFLPLGWTLLGRAAKAGKPHRMVGLHHETETPTRAELPTAEPLVTASHGGRTFWNLCHCHGSLGGCP